MTVEAFRRGQLYWFCLVGHNNFGSLLHHDGAVNIFLQTARDIRLLEHRQLAVDRSQIDLP